MLRMKNFQGVKKPVVQRAMIFKFQSTDRMGDPFDRIRLSVSKIIHGIDAPRVACPVMLCVKNAIDNWISHIQIWRCHIDFCSKHARAILEFSCPHTFKQVQVFFNRTISIRAILARLCQGAAVLSDLICAKVAHVRLTVFYELNSIFMELLKVVRCIKLPILPIESKPPDVLFDRFHIFYLLLAWIGVIKSQVTNAPKLLGKPKIEADRFGVSNMQIAIGFRWKSRMNPPFIFVCLQVFGYDISNKVRRG